MNPTIFYKKGLNSSHRGLHIINPNFGWVEYLQQNNKAIYYAQGITPQLYQLWTDVSYKRLVDAFIHGDSFFIGLLKHLTQVRMENRFTLPLFAFSGSTPSQTKISCGATRFLAELINKTTADNIPVVFQQTGAQGLPSGIVAELVSSTDEFDRMANLVSVDYEIYFDSNGTPVVTSSLVNPEVYHVATNMNYFVDIGLSVMNFWQRFSSNGKINITVSCNNPKQITYDPALWNVEVLPLPENTLSYGAIMGKFQELTDGKLHLWMHPQSYLKLENLLVWPDDRTSCWWHTKDKNLHLFETTAGPLSMHRSISIIGNIVK